MADAVSVRVEEADVFRRRRTHRRARRGITRRDYDRFTAALLLILFSSVIMLWFGWECHGEFVQRGLNWEFVEHCGPVYEIIALGLILLLPGIGLLIYAIHRALSD